ncbi:multidrug efflux RND transporter permease subunit [Pseudenhygromyxa sp. WMMC2535]|uniref:multidrug efflux RND transporter permease subunit n=1 Tax=Pseudenhygromyxa sp. WMMC2535 TaxID=2712867 RepID=UPI001557EE48|nr:multidrug efflux RND transporter permease subunit [Pseudenhygromyxa sp. WMMC2535]NVB40995.1 multidrug efflux RND transporter permease subunit [Pseudenhygromyxa sp. WMMC2535]
MSLFFTDRPVFAWVVALFIALAGILALQNLPVAQYPSVAPPAVVISAVWPGATAELIDESVTSVIEQELNSAENLLYMESQSQAGQAQITVSFQPGTDPQMATVDVQNLIKRVEARLPSAVKQQGVQVTRSSSSFLLIASLVSENYSSVELGDYINRNIANELRRVPGVGEALVFGTEHAMRVWLEPRELVSHDLTAADVAAAIQAQNVTVSAGTIGDKPSTPTQQIYANITVDGQLKSIEDFENIVVQANADGSLVHLGDVARVELGGQSYSTAARTNGKPSAAIAIRLSPTGNALATAEAVKTRLDELSESFPEGIEVVLPFDSSTFIDISIESVLHTLVEAMILVFIVMFVFLQNLRATLIPTIVVPVALLGSLTVLYAFGYSINVLTMFGMVLAIGILVDDAIVVVENVERIMAEEHLGPREATRKAMSQIQGAIVGITVVLVVVFLPMGLFGGAVGVIYRQFTVTMASSILFSALLALSLTPALCATLLKPHEPGKQKAKIFQWFDKGVNHTTSGYVGVTGRFVRRTGLSMVFFLGLSALAGWTYMKLPGSFLPEEDQGTVMTLVQLPAGASSNRTAAVVEDIEGKLDEQEGVRDFLTVQGFSHVGRGQNAAMAFAMLDDWDERELEATDIVGQLNGRFQSIRDAWTLAVNPPPIRELGTATGFSFRLEDRGGQGHEALLAARNQLLGAAAQSEILAGVRPEGLEDASQIELYIDREKAAALGVSFSAIGQTLGIAVGSSYVNDFPRAGRQQQVIVQADAAARMQPEDLAELYVRNDAGDLVSLAEISRVEWGTGPIQLTRYNGYPAMKIAGSVRPGRSTGEGMAEMERLAAELPKGFDFEWTGQSYQEATSSNQAPALFGLSLLVVFLCLAALYEGWAIPTAVLLVVPLGVLGTVLATQLRGLPDDVYFKVGLIAVIGLSAKNAILIVEFAKEMQEQGMKLVAAVLEAARLRFRPIVMTSLAFSLGVVPLVIASGAGSASQRAIGTAVFGGMVVGSFLAVFLVPVFYVVIRRWFPARDLDPAPAAAVSGASAPTVPAQEQEHEAAVAARPEDPNA